MRHFKYYNRQDILNLTRHRRYETKLGEKIRTIQDPAQLLASLQESPSKFVVFGISEDLGVIANGGVGGTDTAWKAFVQSFVNIQSTDKFTGDEILIAGWFDFEPLKTVILKNARGQDELVDACRHAVANQVDEEVEELVKIIVAAGKIPIVIGGGHNNCYPLIKGSAKSLQKLEKSGKSNIHSVNVDAHADFRIMEGRHSGNGFRYAMEEGYLGKYAVVGLQENYNSQSILDDLYSNLNIHYVFYEDIFLHERMDFRQAVAQAFGFVEENFVGVELDLDCLERVLSSAQTPSGISSVQARQYMQFAGLHPKVAYLHICEGATALENGQADPQTGKLLSFLVSDFVKSGISA